MFSKILIANRGEIACRVIKSAKRMGIATVAVYSDADVDALHVSMADEAVHIGAAPASESYLVMDRIIAAAKKTGAQAVHPGYGFLSERAEFCELLEKEGIVFIGPKERAITAMGDKITSKKLAQEAGVTTVPGHMELIDDADEAAKISAGIGYPVMIKASAGGGGKGMRIAWNDEEARDGFERSKSEAASSFGDDRIFIEKFVEEPRHIEIQILADGHGNCVYLGERECSIQRRNQKVIEEAPSCFLDEATRQAMGAEACALASAVDYQSAGTVEFIVDKDRNFYFLEMNTRLQVEHPVTELITGIDLVEQMIRIAAGEKLTLKQDDVKLNGWAIESRVYAEDPVRGFLPSIGRLTKYRPPETQNNGQLVVRNDTGVFEGSEISMFYDPMIAKLCTWAPDRLTAIDAMRDALDGFVIDGIAHNIPFLASLMAHPRWQEGRITTNFIAEEYPDGFAPATARDDDARVIAAVALSIELLRALRLSPENDQLHSDWAVKLVDDYSDVSISDLNHAETLNFTRDEIGQVKTDYQLGDPYWRGQIGDRDVVAQIRSIKNGVRVEWRGYSVEAKVMRPQVAALDRLMPAYEGPDTAKFLLCPMPGLVVSLNVAEGQAVQTGDVLAVVEAMKMENVLRAERDGVVKSVNTKAGESLAVDAIILEFE